MQNYAKLCTTMENMQKYAHICKIQAKICTTMPNYAKILQHICNSMQKLFVRL